MDKMPFEENLLVSLKQHKKTQYVLSVLKMLTIDRRNLSGVDVHTEFVESKIEHLYGHSFLIPSYINTIKTDGGIVVEANRKYLGHELKKTVAFTDETLDLLFSGMYNFDIDKDEVVEKLCKLKTLVDAEEIKPDDFFPFSLES